MPSLAALFVSSFDDSGHYLGTPDLAVLVEAADEGAARDFLGGLARAAATPEQDRTYAGVDYDYFDGGSAGLAAGAIDYDAARPYFSAFASLVAGSRMEGGLALARFTVSLAG